MVEAIIPSPIKTQIQAILNKDEMADRVALVWPEPIEPAESPLEISGTSLRLVYCPSELSMRETLVLHKSDKERLVILSPFDETRLGKDVLARLWGNEPKRISPWRTLEQLLGVSQIDPRLTGQDYRWIAECLVSTYDRYKSQINFGEVLDFDKAWQSLALALLGYSESSLDIDSLLEWSLGADVSEVAKALPDEVKAHLGDWLEPRLGKSSLLVQKLWDQGHASDMVAVGLVCSLIYQDGQKQSQEIFQARGRLTERFLGGTKIDNSTLRKFGERSVSFVERYLQHQSLSSISTTFAFSEQVLVSLDLLPLAVESDLLPIAFGQRLEQFAKSLKRSINGKQMEATLSALAALKSHQLAKLRKDQVRTAELAVHTCAWLQTENPQHDSARSVIEDYIENGGHLDWARSRIWSGDENESVSKVYEQLTRKISERRDKLNQQFSHHFTAITRGDHLGDWILPVEKALNELVAPLAKQQRVLLLVIDGMSQAVYRELSEDLISKNWVELQRDGSGGPGALIAALPTITKVSRFSLLAGTIGEGVSADEKKAFARHPDLKALASTKFPPKLFHKGDLQKVGSGALAGSVREVIAGMEFRIVGAVINAVDDQLGSGAQLAVSWTVESISLLQQILEAARESGRLVIFTSDHGHVLEHDMKYHKTFTDAERYKHATEGKVSGEIMIEGVRVVQPDHKVILPWSEKIRYARKKMGYHGGASLQEVVIPVGVYRNSGEDSSIDGWREVPKHEPSWWQPEKEITNVVEDTMTLPIKPTRKPKKDEKTQDLFEKVTGDVVRETGNDDCVENLLSSPIYLQRKSRLGRVNIGEDQLKNLLNQLIERGGQQMIGSLIQTLEIPSIRITGFLAGAQKLLNIDGYPILSIDRSTKTVNLNIDSLKTQFEL